MVDDHNLDYTESKPLNTEIETLAPEATAAQSDLSSVSTPTQTSESLHPEAGNHDAATATVDIQANEEPDYDAADFAAALANFDREQAAESAAAQSLTAEEVIVGPSD